MARTAVTQQALNNKWWAAQGLLSVKDLWCKAQGYTQKENLVVQASLLNTLQAAPARDAPTLRQSQIVLRTVCVQASAHCGPARWVVWGLEVRSLWLPD